MRQGKGEEEEVKT